MVESNSNSFINILEQGEETTNLEEPEVEDEKEKSDTGLSRKVQMLMIAIKAMTAMKLTRDDKVPAKIVEGVYLGSVGSAYNKDSLKEYGITHILTCADKIKPRFPDV